MIAIDIHGLLPQTKSRTELVTHITERYIKLTCANPTPKISSTHLSHIFLSNWVILYGIPDIILSDRDQQFISKLFISRCHYLGEKRTLTTTYHPQTNRQTESYNRTLLSRLRLYVAYSRRNWDISVQSLTFSYICQPQRSTTVPPSSFTLT